MEQLTEYHIGTSGWAYPHWRGAFYPQELPQGRWLNFYAQHLATVELNNTFYHLPPEQALERWRESTPPNFLFSVKVSRLITHLKKLAGVEEPLENFLRRARLLREKLGPLLYQLPPGLHRNDELLKAFLTLLPRDLQHVFEFRHESWLDEGVLALLAQHNASFCVFDMPRRRCPVVATADFSYVRFHGTERLYGGCYSTEELTQWARVITQLGEGRRAVYAYFNNDIGGNAVRNALELRGLLSGTP